MRSIPSVRQHGTSSPTRSPTCVIDTATTNGIPGLPRLLADLDLSGVVPSADALHAQRETARHLVADRGAHYVLGRVRGLSKRGARLPTAGSYPVAHLE